MSDRRHLRTPLFANPSTGPRSSPVARAERNSQARRRHFLRDIVAALGGAAAGVETVSRWNALDARFEIYVVGGPGAANSLSRLDQRDAVVVRLAPDRSLTWEQASLLPIEGGERTITLAGGINLAAVTAPAGITVAELFSGRESTVVSVQTVDAEGRWRTWIPGAPGLVNTLEQIAYLDVMYARVGGPLELSWSELVAP